MSSSTAPDSATPEATPAPAQTSSNPFTLLSSLDSSKKYTLVFLLSVGTTLLVTGESGGRLLKRANAPAPVPPTPPAAAPSIPPLRAARPPSSLPVPPSAHQTKRTKPLLREWRTSTSSLSPARDADYFLPNLTLLSRSAEFATELDAADRLHKDGEEEEGPYVDDGFNPAVFAAKAFAIATGITVGAFALAVGGVMSWFGVKDVSGLAGLAVAEPGGRDWRRRQRDAGSKLGVFVRGQTSRKGGSGSYASYLDDVQTGLRCRYFRGRLPARVESTVPVRRGRRFTAFEQRAAQRRGAADCFVDAGTCRPLLATSSAFQSRSSTVTR